MSLVPIDPTNETSVLTLLESCATWLSTAVERCAPEDVANVKAQMATVAEATKQLGLSKEIQLDAVEMVRRAEYALGKKIRQGQADGSIRPSVGGDTRTDLSDRVGSNNQVSPSAFATKDELYANGAGLMHLADADPEDFAEALTEAKAEGNLSRANVVRKVKGQKTAHVTREARADMIRNLADQGYSSRQMPAKVGVTEETVRQIARDFDIEIPADRVIGRTRRLDHTQMVESTVTDLENTAEFVASFIDFNEVDMDAADEWVESLNRSVAAFRKFAKEIENKRTARAATRTVHATHEGAAKK